MLVMIGIGLILSAVMDRFMMGDLFTTYWLLIFYGDFLVGTTFILLSLIVKEENQTIKRKILVKK